MKQLYFILGIAFIMLANFPKLYPRKLLTRRQMIAILVDLEIASAMVRHYTKDESTTTALLQKNKLLIYNFYDIDSVLFQKSYQYYLNRMKILKGIYNEVVQQLENKLKKEHK